MKEHALLAFDREFAASTIGRRNASDSYLQAGEQKTGCLIKGEA